MNRSYWHATLDRPQLPAAELPRQADVVVVGGGVLGAMATYWLARRGAAPLLLERGGLAAGATGHNGGLCSAGTAEGYAAAAARVGRPAARQVWALSHEGFELLHELVADERIDCELRRTGNLGLALDEAQLAAYAEGVALLREDGFAGVELLDRQQAQDCLGAEFGPEIVGAKFNQHGSSLHSARLIHGVLSAAARMGARLCLDVEVTALEASSGLVTIQTRRGPIVAGAVVVAVNAWSGDLLPELGGLITAVRGQALATGPAPVRLRCPFGASVTATGEYGQQTPAGALIFGGCRAVAPGRDVGVREMAPTVAVQTAIDEALGRLLPAMAGVEVERRWAGLMAFTPDYLPIAGAAPGREGVWFAGGFCGHGMPFAAPLGRLLAEAALSGRTPEALAPLDPERQSLRQ